MNKYSVASFVCSGLFAYLVLSVFKLGIFPFIGVMIGAFLIGIFFGMLEARNETHTS